MRVLDLASLASGHGSVKASAHEVLALLDGERSSCGAVECAECLEWVARSLARTFRRQARAEEEDWTRLDGSATPPVRSSLDAFAREHAALRRRLEEACEALGDPRIPFSPDVRANLRWIVDDLVDHLEAERRALAQVAAT